MPKKRSGSAGGKMHGGPVGGSHPATPHTRAGLNSQMKALHDQKAAAKAAHDSSQVKSIRDAMRANRAQRAQMIARKKAK